ncbi:MAG: DUF853 family protein [Archangium sp.]|nr:DUF853 family protein [Archangium sp.]MDP3151812.1 DUF853 family protein [Archangium sp.]MDP3573330.1 DUF853 family protein [Archangium sp.]
MLTLGTSLDATALTLETKALTTHGFILGMTGSGKTGLCVVLVEELLRAGVPVLAVDSKGDLATLLLSADPHDARLQKAMAQLGLTAEAFAAFRASYQPRLYTPGATLGLPVDLLGSLGPPADGAPESLAEAADGAARSLLGLVGVEADPLTSREYLLLVQLLSAAWQQGQTPTLSDLVRQVATPPFATVGALPLEDFFPQKDRQNLMVRLNGLLASPKFAAWRTGEPLDPGVLLKSPDGRPRLSIYSVAHLSEEERLFAVAQLLERTQSWMRKQGGSSGLRAVLLIDEIYGYFPPGPANPPTKPPLLGLLKQARAFGLSVVLATQNPIDLDYRGLANIGTWLIGRLQTDQDKARIRDALLSAASATGISGTQLDDLISKLEPRKFLLHSVHRPQPTVFTSRDALTELRGPFSAAELRQVSSQLQQQAVAPAVAAPSAVTSSIDPELGPLFEVDQGQALPYLLLKFGVRYRLGTAVSEETVHELAFPLEGAHSATEVLEGDPLSVKGVRFQPTAPVGLTPGSMPAWVNGLKAAKLQAAIRERLPSKLETKLTQDAQTKLISGPTETPEAFAARVIEKQGVSKDRQKLARDLEKRRADYAQAEKELSSRKAEKWLNVGAGVLGLFSGRRSSLSGVGRALASNRQQGGSEAKLEDLALAIQQLEKTLAEQEQVDPRRFVEQVVVPRAGDVQVLRLSLAWIVP